MTTLWLLVVLAALFWWVRRDARAYAQFKTLSDPAARERSYWRWIAESFAGLAGGGMVTVWLLGREGAVLAFPAEFEPLRAALDAPSASDVAGTTDGLIGMVVGAGLAAAVIAAVQWRRLRRIAAPVIGDIEPLLPRTGRERAIALVLSANAGVSEELFFRLALPLLLLDATGSLTLALAGATIAFGLAHAYQGWKGVAATMLVGGVLLIQYCASGSLLRVMLLHAAIDVVALVLRPTLSAWVAQRRAVPA